MATVQANSLLVAAIDFGTTYSGYAFSFRHEYDKDPTQIRSNNTWIAGHKNLFSLKTPTCVLLDPQQSFVAFGYEAEDRYNQLSNEDNHHGWLFFKRFKMSLHENVTLNRGFVIKDVSGKTELPAKTIFAHGIRFLKNHLTEHVKKQGIDDIVPENDYTWVLTVPAIWNDSAKQFMREAAEEAGIRPSQLMISLEPEAAALYCRVLPVEKLARGDGCCAETDFTMFKTGTEYMVLDIGGGTVDVTVQRVLHDGKLKELHKASGGAWGGTKVDEAFLQLLLQIVGGTVIKKFKTENTGDELELFREFETKKRTIENSTTAKVTLRIPIQLSMCFEDEYSEKLKDVIKQTKYAGKLSWTADKLRVHPSVIQELFKESADSIVLHVKELLQHPKCKNVDTIIMVGGFSECSIIQEAVKNNFSDRRIIIPEDAGLAVVKGAVLFGHCPHTIVSRKTKFTYGVRITRDFRHGDPPDKKKKVDGREKCQDVFDQHVRINKTVPVGEPLEPRTYYPLYKDQREINVSFYTSTEEEPKYTTDPSCVYLGKVMVPLPPGTGTDSEIIVKMTFGGTEITVEAEHKPPGKKSTSKPITASFDFLDH